ncbi:MAG: ABC transporter permease, partial [Phycisphaerae bacterium]|nr:ABC transporter permease [Phycisphaerae bacterium]
MGVTILFQRARAVAVVAMGNLFARWPRALVALIAVALGVALVAAVTSGYASARQTILDWNYSWVGHSHVHLQPIPDALWSDPRIPPDLVPPIAKLPGVEQVVTRQKQYLLASTAPDTEPISVYGYGIDLAGEERVRGAGIRLEPGGRMLARSGEVLIERHLADALGRKVGDTIRLGARPESLKVLPIEVDL